MELSLIKRNPDVKELGLDELARNLDLISVMVSDSSVESCS